LRTDSEEVSNIDSRILMCSDTLRVTTRRVMSWGLEKWET
jgi:hypothetical protein